MILASSVCLDLSLSENNSSAVLTSNLLFVFDMGTSEGKFRSFIWLSS